MNRPVTRWISYGAVPLGLTLAPLFLPLYRLDFDISTFLTVISLLFAILVGFFIASATTNYFRLQTLVAEENSGWISLYNLGVLLDKSVKKRLSDAIDLYVIATLNFELMDYIERSLPAFQKVLKIIDAIRGRNPGTEALIQNLHDVKTQVIMTRQEIPLTARRIVTTIHWAILVLLGTLVIFLLFMLRDGHWASALSVGILAVATYLVLVLIYEIDGNYFAEEKLAFENAQILFQSIDKLNYYPDYALADDRIQNPVFPYRTGTYADPTNPLLSEIKTIRRKK